MEELTRLQQKKLSHQKAIKERTDNLNELHLSYTKIKDELAFKDILEKISALEKYHTKVAKDGVGSKPTGEFDESGNERMELVYLSQEKRVAELDRAAGIGEINSYLERQVSQVDLAVVGSKKVVS
jgi:hypothetical protein